MRQPHRNILAGIVLAVVFASKAVYAGTPPAQAQPDSYADVLQYIDHAWDVLTRSMDGCDTITDPKMPEQSVLYVPAEYAISERLKQLETRCKVRVAQLPQRITREGEFNSATLPRQGLLFLENSYVLPGGFFNEMYGWDSYFILRGLVRAGRLELARGMVDNFFFE